MNLMKNSKNKLHKIIKHIENKASEDFDSNIYDYINIRRRKGDKPKLNLKVCKKHKSPRYKPIK